METFDDRTLMFKKRKGTTNKGTEYENLVIAFLTLQLTLDDTVKDFRLSSNDRNFGAFDDVIVEVEWFNGGKEKYAIQLKYSNDRILTRNSLAEQNGNFSIKKYLIDYKKLKIVTDFKFVLFTNRKFDISDRKVRNGKGDEMRIEIDKKITIDDCEVYIEKRDGGLLDLRKGQCFKFVAKSSESFFDAFFLYTDQMDVEELRRLIFELFKGRFQRRDLVSKEYLDFIAKWSDFEGNKTKLHKEMMRRKLVLILLGPFIVTLKPRDTFDLKSPKIELLKRIIFRSQTIGFSQSQGNKLRTLWGDPKSKLAESEELARKLGLLYQISTKSLDEEVCSKLLWLMGTCPLIVHEDETTKKVISLCPGMNFVTLGQTWIKKISYLDEDVFDEVLETFECSLQGKSNINLKELIGRSRLSEVVTTDELVTMTASNFLIGEKEVLPIPHVCRFLTRNMINWEILDFGPLYNSIIVITNCHDCPTLRHKSVRISDDFSKLEEIWKIHRGEVIFVTHCEFSKEYFAKFCNFFKDKRNYHQFRIFENHLEWVRSRNGVATLKKFRLENYYISESELSNYQNDNKIHIVCAGPGMGKTTLMRHLKNNSPPNIWVLSIYARNHSGHFDDMAVFIEHILDEIDTTLERQIVENLMKERRVEFVWDGLDEVSDRNLALILDLVDEIDKMGMTQWITSRDNLKEILETRFGVLSRTIKEFDEEEQWNYIRDRLDCSNADPNDVFSKIKKNIQLFPDNDILGIPLQIYILTELFRQDPSRYSNLLNNNIIFALTDLYRHFIDEKFKIYFREKEKSVTNNDLFEARNRCFKMEQMDYYERVAIKNFGLSDVKFFAVKDPIGIIIGIRGMTAEFVHKSFDDYFAASFLSKNLHLVVKFSNFLSDEKYNNVRFFFDLFLAKNSQVHTAVLYKNLQLLKNCTEEELVVRDSGGRNALQLACSWGQKYPILKVTDEGDGVYEIDDSHTVTKRDTVEYCQIFDVLSKVCDHKQTDDLFHLTSVSYAYRSLCLISFVKLLKPYKVIFKDFDNVDAMCTILYYCVLFDYDEIFEIVKDYPEIEKTSNYYTLLDLAVTHNSIKCVKVLSKKLDYDTNIQIMRASRIGSCDLVQHFIDLGADINEPCERSPMTVAVDNGHYDVVKLLIDNGAQMQENLLETPITFGNFKIIKLLIDNGATVNAKDVCRAIFFMKHEIVKLLISKMSNVNFHDEYGNSPIITYCQEGGYNFIKLLIDKGADVNDRDRYGRTPLHLSCENYQIVKLLIDKGADVNNQDLFGRTPLHLSRENYHIIKLLIENKANVNAVSVNGKTALHLVTNIKIVKFLIDNNADVNICDTLGNTPLHSAAEFGNYDKLILLLKCQVNPNCQNNQGETPLHKACETGNLLIVETLIVNGANVNITSVNKKSPIHSACQGQRLDIIQLLVKNGADVNATNKLGEIPIHWSCEEGLSDIVKFLIEAGADINHRTDYDETPLDLGKRFDNIVKLLEENGAKK